MLTRALMIAGFLLALVPSVPASADYVRDELHINMRTGPGNQYRILRVLVSGEQVSRLGENDGWVNVRSADGQEGWVPDGYVIPNAPASVALPRVEAKLTQTQAKIEELQAKLATQIEAITELDDLRARNEQLETENMQLVGSAFWKTLGMGALIALGGLIVGAMWPRGGGRSKRIKL